MFVKILKIAGKNGKKDKINCKKSWKNLYFSKTCPKRKTKL